MHRYIIILSAAIFLVSCKKKEVELSAGAHKPMNAPDVLEGISTSFVPNAILTNSELRDLVQLAAQCGIQRVSQIRTYYIHPSSNCGIQIKSTEVINERKVSFVTVNLRYKDPYDDERIEDIIAAIGDFKVREGRIKQNTLTTFSMSDGTIRVQVADDLSIDTADRIVRFFEKGQVSYENQSLRDKLLNIDLTMPQSLDYKEDEDTFIITFAIGEFGTAVVKFTFKSEELIVLEVQKVVS